MTERVILFFDWRIAKYQVNEGCLSNFYPSPFQYKGRVYQSVEQYFSAQKSLVFSDGEAFHAIMQESHPKKVKILGKTVKNFDAERWDKLKGHIMLDGLYAKFSQNAELKSYLLSTGDAILAEASPHDCYWGIGCAETDDHIQNLDQWQGQNQLGELLMYVRRVLHKRLIAPFHVVNIIAQMPAVIQTLDIYSLDELIQQCAEAITICEDPSTSHYFAALMEIMDEYIDSQIDDTLKQSLPTPNTYNDTLAVIWSYFFEEQKTVGEVYFDSSKISNLLKLIHFDKSTIYPFWKHKIAQWSTTSFHYDGQHFTCAEQAMMYSKAKLFSDETIMQAILATDSPQEHQALGRQVSGFDGDTWNKHKQSIVIKINYARFSQNEEDKEVLLATSNAWLVEASPTDTIWGVGIATKNPNIYQPELWQGQNLLGQCLMIVRDLILISK